MMLTVIMKEEYLRLLYIEIDRQSTLALLNLTRARRSAHAHERMRFCISDAAQRLTEGEDWAHADGSPNPPELTSLHERRSVLATITWLHLQGFTIAAGNVSKMLHPEPGDHSRQRLRDVFEVTPESALRAHG
jgi:hypothetical protein